MKSMNRYFFGSYVVTVLGLVAGAGVGWLYNGTIDGAVTALFLTLILSVLEVSLSFDNAVVNAAVLKDMAPVWRQRFITWGIPIAVFGMRILFPLVIVSVIAHIDPWAALVMAATKPDQYRDIMLSSHIALAGFGGSFLLMVAFAYFLDHEKDIHWFTFIEKPLTKIGKIEAVGMGLCLLVFFILSRFLAKESDQLSLILSGIFGMLTYVTVDGISSILQSSAGGKKSAAAAAKSGMAMFVYLQILDASFSFDGVIGAFAITNNLFIIAIGLGIGAMFVRSMTLFLVDKGTLSQFIFLEHGAFYAIGALAMMMLFDVFGHIPEVVTGLIGAVLIALSIVSSIRHTRKKKR